ncbi:hypothetical protein CMK18_00550 [Candidatus Poribacteria bacterium]|nr:hypothetical protein [Candidatus Poribacteria bacterium]
MASYFSTKTSLGQVDVLLTLGLRILKVPDIYRHKKFDAGLGWDFTYFPVKNMERFLTVRIYCQGANPFKK